MRYLASYLLLTLSGKEDVSVKDIVSALKASNVEAKEETA